MTPSVATAFILVLCRCGAAVMLLPGLGEQAPPARVRVALAGALAILLTPVVAPALPPLPDDAIRLAPLVIGELLIGAALGWSARVIAFALQMAGQVIATTTGLSSVLSPDGVLGSQNAATGQLLGMAAPVLVLSTGLYALPLTALAGSYATFPVGGALPAGDFAQEAARGADASFALGLRLAAPFVITGCAWQVAIGLLARLVPQLQVFFAALPGQVLGGLLLFSLLGGTLLRTWLAAMP